MINVPPKVVTGFKETTTLNSIFTCALIVFAPVLLTPAKCSEIIVCIEEDDDLRVDCLIDSKIGQINDYEFSWSSGTKEVILNTNVSGSHADSQFKDKKSYVTELSPKGYRLTVEDTKDKLPYNTTYICKVSGVSAQAILQKGM